MRKFSTVRRGATGAIVFAAGVVLGVAAHSGNAGELSAREPRLRTHQTHAEIANTEQLTASIEPVSSAAPTRSSFMAIWNSVSGANGYLLDVSTNASFTDYVKGYHDLDVGNVTGRLVTGLSRATRYYYRVRSYTNTGLATYSQPARATTLPTTGLTIDATFDSSITNNPNAAAIEAMINRAISIYESLFNDPITVHIYFRYAATAPDGTALPPGTVSRSDFVVYTIPWNAFVNALRANASTSNDSLAIASLPANSLAANVNPSGSNGRAVGLDTPPAMFANGHVGNGGPYDGIVTMNSTQPFQFSRPPDAGRDDAQRAVEHEIDEVLGLGSNASLSNLTPEDLFSWSARGQRNVSSNGTRYFSIDSGSTNIVDFNQDHTGDYGDWFSEGCPQTQPYVQNAFTCSGQFSDIGITSPEAIALDVIGYDLAHAAFFMGEIPLGNGIYYLQFPNGTPFGYYSYLADPHWIYHFDMGYEYWFDANDGRGGVFLYDVASNTFFYTSPSFPFPYLYDFSLNTLLYYFPDPNNPGHYTSNPRYFYDFATGQIITK